MYIVPDKGQNRALLESARPTRKSRSKSPLLLDKGKGLEDPLTLMVNGRLPQSHFERLQNDIYKMPDSVKANLVRAG